MAAPTLATIKKLIEDNHKEVQSRLEKLEARQEGVEEQVKLTNGRVKALETAEAVSKGIEGYKKEQEAQSGSNPKVNWSALIPYAIALCAALIAIGQAVGK